MVDAIVMPPQGSRPRAAAVLELLKPVTWFAPMWAFGCGVVSSGVTVAQDWPVVLLGVGDGGVVVVETAVNWLKLGGKPGRISSLEAVEQVAVAKNVGV